jgi:hypothetical protein
VDRLEEIGFGVFDVRLERLGGKARAHGVLLELKLRIDLCSWAAVVVSQLNRMAIANRVSAVKLIRISQTSCSLFDDGARADSPHDLRV